MSEGRPPVRRVGRRRVVTAEPAGLEPRSEPAPAADPDPDSADALLEDRADEEIDYEESDHEDGGHDHGGSDRDAWLRAQVPPHWS